MTEEQQRLKDIVDEDVQANSDESVDYTDSLRDQQQPHDDDSRQNPQIDTAKFLQMLTMLYIMRAGEQTVDDGGDLKEEMDTFIPAVHSFHKDIYEFIGEEVKNFRALLEEWNTFLKIARGSETACAISSAYCNNYITVFKFFLEEVIGRECDADYTRGIHFWIPCWNMFLQARQGRSPMTRTSAALTVMGVLFYVVDMVSDMGTAVYFGYNGQWWQCGLTLGLVYGSVTLNTVFKFIDERIHCAGPLDRLRYVASLLVNWPDLQLCWTLLRLEVALVLRPRTSAAGVAAWQQHRQRVAMLKWTEGLCEACPQAVLQLCLLLPDLEADITWIACVRIVSTLVSLCSAGAALVNLGNIIRFEANLNVPVRTLLVLHLWAVPVTVSRLLSLALLLTVHLYGGLAGMALHLALFLVVWGQYYGCPRTLHTVFMSYQASMLFLISPFLVFSPMASLLQRHGVHFVCNTCVTVLWALTTRLGCTQSALYVAIITFNAVMMTVGLVTGVVYKLERRKR